MIKKNYLTLIPCRYSALPGRLMRRLLLPAMLILMPGNTLSKEVKTEYVRINLGGSFRIQGAITVQDSITLHQGSSLQSSTRFKISGVETKGNNGVVSEVTAFSANLKWDPANSSSAQGFIIMRALALGGPYQIIGAVGASTNEFVDSSLEAGTTYHYQIWVDLGSGNIVVHTDPFSTTTQAAPSAIMRVHWGKYK